MHVIFLPSLRPRMFLSFHFRKIALAVCADCTTSVDVNAKEVHDEWCTVEEVVPENMVNLHLQWPCQQFDNNPTQAKVRYNLYSFPSVDLQLGEVAIVAVGSYPHPDPLLDLPHWQVLI